MSTINTVSFEKLSSTNLIVDTVYQAGNTPNHSSEVLSKVTHVGNSGGFRKCTKIQNGKKGKETAYVCIFTTGNELEWRDELDRTLGRFTYWGDNRVAGNPITNTKFKGNLFLQETFSKMNLGLRKLIAPVFVFQKYTGRDVIFLGLAVPGDRRINPQDALVAVWAQNRDGRYQNYKAVFTILDVPEIDRRWLIDLEHDKGLDSVHAPKVWKDWVVTGKYRPLITDKNPIQYRHPNEQLPEIESKEFRMLNQIIQSFPNPYEFESFACKLIQIMDSNIVSVEQTRAVRDGGRDAVCKYHIGPTASGIDIEFALEAKRYQIENSVGVKETSRLISRIKHRQFGVLVTTSYVADQAYKEIVEDNHPIIVIAGKDIIDILLKAGISSEELLQEWLDVNFKSITNECLYGG